MIGPLTFIILRNCSTNGVIGSFFSLTLLISSLLGHKLSNCINPLLSIEKEGVRFVDNLLHCLNDIEHVIFEDNDLKEE